VKFKIEQIGTFNTDAYVIACRLEPGEFAVSETSRLGGVSIRQSSKQPRKLKPDGTLDANVFAFVLTNREDVVKFFVGQTVELKS
jgi:hypothetical protein